MTQPALSGVSDETTGGNEFRRGWGIVLAALLGTGLGLSPMPFYTFGVFAPHLASAFGWSMGEIMGGLGVTTLMVAWAGPLAGLLAVRFGARRVALISTVLFGLSFMLLAFSNGSLTLFYATWGVIAALGAGTLPMTWTRPVNRWFDVHKGLAIGITMTGSGLFGIASKPYLAWVIGAYGWRIGYVALGILPLLISFPAALLLFHDNAAPRDGLIDVPSAGENGLTLSEAVRAWRFWLLAVLFLPISFALAGPIPNLEIILRDDGLPAADILKLTSMVGFTALFGRLAGGWLMDHIWAPAVGFVILALPAISCWLLAAHTLDFDTAGLAIGLLGFALGVEYDLIAFLIARYFGLRSYAAIYGCLFVSYSFGAGLGPFFYGRDHDLHGNYQLALTISLGLLVIGAGSLLLLGHYRRFDAEPADKSQASSQ